MTGAGIVMSAESDALLEVGRLLKKARLAAAMKQEQVADLAGISRPRYRDIETGVVRHAQQLDQHRPGLGPGDDADPASDGSCAQDLAASA